MKQFKSQSGRSMVEMLGVLAIVGVLSIGGIMGYSYGMDKYRANETTNQIMLRAIDLMTQASNNNAELSLAAWENEETQYTFGEVGSTYDGLIYLDVAGLPKSVCEMVFDNMSGTAAQIDINATPANSNDACADENEMTFYFEGGISGTCDPACPEGQYCDNGICFKGEIPEGTGIVFDKECTSNADCNTEWTGTCAYCGGGKCIGFHAYDGDDCTINKGNVAGLCNLGICYPKGCSTNNDCTEPGTYCATSDSSSDARFQEGEKGSCVPLYFVRKEIDGEIYYICNEQMSWWNAEYACKAIGSNIDMVKVTDLIEEASWNGEGDSAGTYTPLAQELYTLLGNRSIWTQNLTSDKKKAFSVYLASSTNIDSTPYTTSYYRGGVVAVCK